MRYVVVKIANGYTYYSINAKLLMRN